MAFFDRLDQAAGWVGDWWTGRWNAVGDTFSRSWGETLPDGASKFWSGLSGLATLPWDDEGDFGKAGRAFLDGLVGMGSGLLGGTLGTLGEMPIVHEPLQALDTVYRYGIARPISTAILAGHNADAAAWDNEDDEYKLGDGLMSLFTPETWRQSWNESARATPGQAMIWTAGGALAWAQGDDGTWLEEHDPRTKTGQATFNSEDAEFWLKYGSGTVDLLGAVFADPAHGASKAAAAAKLTYVDHVATPAYVADGKVAAEVGSSRYEKVRQAALAAPNAETFRDLTMPDARFGGPVAAVLYDAARMDGTVFDDAYLTARAGDAAALGRLVKAAPAIASDLTRLGADWQLGNYARKQDEVAEGTYGDGKLALSDADALVEQLVTGRGTWGALANGPLIGEKQPTVRVPSKLRAGYHNWVLHTAPVIVSAPLRRLMPSQGWTPALDAVDGSGIALQQFRSNLERADFGPDEINGYTSMYGAATSDVARRQIAADATEKALAAIAQRRGVGSATLDQAVAYWNKWQIGMPRATGKAVYISDRARRLAERYIEKGKTAEAAAALRYADEYPRQYENGEPGYLPLLDGRGVTNLVEIGGTERKAPPPGEPVLSSQLGEMIFMPDFRSVDAAVKWWSRMHPPTNAPLWRVAAGKAAYGKIAWDVTISALDFANMLWKASALARPAQMPRNLGDEAARAGLRFGKSYLAMGAVDGVRRGIANVGVRARTLTERRAKRQAYTDLSATGTGAAPGNLPSVRNPTTYNTWDSVDEAFIDGALGLDDLLRMADDAAGYQLLPSEEMSLWNGRKAGIIDAAEYRQTMARTILGRAGRAWYLDLGARTRLLEGLRASNAANRAAGAGPGQLLVDPFTGITPAGLKGQINENFDRISAETIRTDYDAPAAGTRQLADFIEKHVDELLKPNHLLGLWVKPDSHIGIGVLRAKEHVVATEPIKLSARERLANLQFGGLRAAGHTGFSIKTAANPDGYKLAAVFAGHVGDKLQKRSSSRGPGGAWRFIVGDVLGDLGQPEGWGKPIRPDEKGYGPAWERAVNAQLASDPVARLFLQGKSDVDVLARLETEAWGREYLDRMHFRAVSPMEHVSDIKGMVEDLLPNNGSPASLGLRQAVLQKRARLEDLQRAVPPSLLPDVHGESVTDLLADLREQPVRTPAHMVARGIDKIQKVLSDMPVDKASRFPFMAEAYKRHLSDLIKVFDGEYGKEGQIVPVDMIGRLENAARERALHDVKHTLYDTAQRGDLAQLSRLVVPFSSAVMDSFVKYGRTFRANPLQAVQAAYYWQSFERNEMVQDEQGHVLRIEGGEERWYAVDPETGEQVRVPAEEVGEHRYVQFRLPSSMSWKAGQRFFGVDAQPVIAVNKKSFNVFLDPIVSTGPLIAVPANEFSLHHPEFAESKIISEVVLPFGPSGNRAKAALPGNVRTAWDAFMTEQGNGVDAATDGLTTVDGQARAIYQAELIAYGLELRDKPPTFAEARERAGGILGLKFLASWVTPVSFQMRSPYQPYVDAYRQLLAKDPSTADMEFYRTYGEEVYGAMATVTRNNLGMSASLESLKKYRQHQELLARFPDLGGLITGAEGGAFSKAVYEWQKEQPVPGGIARAAAFGSTTPNEVREVQTPQESLEALEKKRGWQGYSQMMDLITATMVERGIVSLRDPRARDLASIKKAYIAKNKTWFNPWKEHEEESPWFVQFDTSGSPAAMQQRVDELWQVAQEPELQQRDDIRGLLEYLSLREEIQGLMARRGTKTLDGRAAKDLRERWEREVFDLVERNVPFGAVWNRYLSNDDSLNLLSREGTVEVTDEMRRRVVEDAQQYQLRQQGYRVMK